jgi:hypothetical protein
MKAKIRSGISVSPSSVLDLRELSDPILKDVEFLNPVDD